MTTGTQTTYGTITRATRGLSTDVIASRLAGVLRRAKVSPLRGDVPPVQSSWVGPIVVVVMGIVLAYDGYDSLLLRQRLAQEGVEVQATAVEARSFRNRFGSRFSVTVTYQARGTAVTRPLGVKEDLFRRITSNGVLTPESLPVRYAESDPNVAMVVVGSQHEGNGELVIGALFVVGGLCCAAYRFARLRRPAFTTEPLG